VLWVQDNLLIALPNTIGKLGQLRVLAVARNPIRSLPADLCRCGSLKEVDVEGLDEYLSIPPLEVARQSVPATLQYLKEYQRRLAWIAETSALDLSSMGLKASTLPLEVTNMTGLTSLNLSRNAMTALSGSLHHMVSLTELDLQECRALRELSPEVGLMTQLKHIITLQCSLSSPPPEVLTVGVPAVLDYLARIYSARASHELLLNGLDLVNTDTAICKVDGLITLSMANNKLQNVSPNLAHLITLQSLDLSGNWLQTLPQELEGLTALTDVDLSDNRLTGPVLLGLWIGAWTNLRHLNARLNPELRRLPLSVSHWLRLEKLLVDEEQFTQPPMEVLRKGARATVEYCGKFSDSTGAVSKIQLNGYKFQRYPEEVNQLTSLKSLQLQYNDIKLLPSSMTTLVNLRELSVSHNPLVKVPQIVSSLTGLNFFCSDRPLLKDSDYIAVPR
jgi:Leucine-rich repeat (LRR) protein